MKAAPLQVIWYLALCFCLSAHSLANDTPSVTTGRPIAAVVTDLGKITIELNAEAAPQTVANFIAYAESYHYDLLIFHRVIDDFMIQTGGYEFDLSHRKPDRDPIVNESANDLKNLRGTVAMARYNDPDSARAQFYINLQHNPHLDATADRPGYTVFGKVVEGMDVVDRIAEVPVRKISPSLTHVPQTAVQIQNILVTAIPEESKP